MARKHIWCKKPYKCAVEAAELAQHRKNCPGAVSIFGKLKEDAGAGHPESDDYASQVFGDMIHFGCISRMK